MNWSLPDSVEIQNTVYPIRTDYRCILDILTDITDPEADGQDRAIALLIGLYPAFADMPPENYDEAIRAGMRFINCDADDAPHRAPRLVDWEQDYSLIIAPVNRAIGAEIRAMEYVHWWTFLAAYQEIGDSTFAQVVRIRDRLRRGKMDKADWEWYRRNRQLVDFRRKYTEAENAEAQKWGF